jgi:hypothetical protein
MGVEVRFNNQVHRAVNRSTMVTIHGFSNIHYAVNIGNFEAMLSVRAGASEMFAGARLLVGISPFLHDPDAIDWPGQPAVHPYRRQRT